MRIKKIKFSDDAKFLLSLFLPLYMIHCMEQIYFIYGTVLESYGLSPATIGNILGSFFLAIMLVRPAGGWMMENLGIKNTLTAGSVFGFVGCGVLFFAESVPVLFAGRIISGAAFGIFTSAIYSYQGLIASEKTRGRLFSLTGSGGVLPTATVTPFGEWLVLSGHTNLFLAMGPLICVICFLLGKKIIVHKTPYASEGKTWGTYRGLLASKPFVMLAITGIMMALVDASSTSISLFASERGLVTSYFLASFSIAAVLVRAAGAKILNVLPRLVCVAPCGMLMGVSLLVIALMPSNTSFIVCGALFGIGIGAGFPMMLASLSDILPPELRPKATASALLLYDAGWTATPLLVGYLTPAFGRAGTFTALAVITFIALAALTIFYWIPKHLHASLR
ncbi:MAG: MFS transporter [Synergistaceae bacterium]|jgi:MFS family permease|nr:MFS transporter [Synergistaceae bacterium]